jgi:hypothetical protein
MSAALPCAVAKPTEEIATLIIPLKVEDEIDERFKN